MITKQEILDEIKRTAAQNGGNPVGSKKFMDETGIDQPTVLRYWVRWGDAIRDAGFQPNKLTAARSEEDLLARLASFIAELGRFPVKNEVQLRARSESGFPWATTLQQRYGSKRALAEKLRIFCENRGQVEIAAICAAAANSRDGASDSSVESLATFGFVYLVKHGSRREYKIGRTFNPLRRDGEIRIELPEVLLPIHQIKTDDPSGVEHYWHARFADKRKNGEWFALTASDVKAFKRWRKIF